MYVPVQLENKELNKKIKSGILVTSDEGSKVLVEELRKREAELDEELLMKTQEVTDLRTAYEEKVRRLEAVVLAKEEELKKKEVTYSELLKISKNIAPRPKMCRLKAYFLFFQKKTWTKQNP